MAPDKVRVPDPRPELSRSCSPSSSEGTVVSESRTSLDSDPINACRLRVVGSLLEFVGREPETLGPLGRLTDYDPEGSRRPMGVSILVSL